MAWQSLLVLTTEYDEMAWQSVLVLTTEYDENFI